MKHEYDDGSSPESYLLGYFNSQLELIDQISLPVHTQGTVISYPTYNGNTAMLNYANLVRSANTQIGCALNGCTDSAGNKLRTLYCLLNEP
ncbi:hypothetical protein Y032_0004g1755 [Ancylostoma ceylanicum]|nr:hypothetical protein Y032_0004g1755 [Ancylostoma ceylanicum]